MHDWDGSFDGRGSHMCDDNYPCQADTGALLDPLESSGIGNDSLAETFRHAGWARHRRMVFDALHELSSAVNYPPGPIGPDGYHDRPHMPVTASRLMAFKYCGAHAFVLRAKNDPTNIKIAASCCHDRFCKPCGNTRSRTIAANIGRFLGKGKCRFVTLTLKHTTATLSHQLERLYESFRKLRKTDLWKKSQRGGVAFLEIKRSRDRQSWHPHFHVLTQGRFIDGQKLSNAWRNITTDSYIVDVRAVRDDKEVLSYVTKYASKPFDPTLFENQTVLKESIVALVGKRMAITFGCWKGLQMTEKPDTEAWDFLDTLEGLCFRASRGDDAARRIVMVACGDRGERLIALAAMRSPPRVMDQVRPPDHVQLTMTFDEPPRCTIY